MKRERSAVQLTFLPPGITVWAHYGDTLLDAALENGVDLPHLCGGNCCCTSCHVIIESGTEKLSAIEVPEEDRLDTARNRTQQSRLACQALLLDGPIVVTICGDENEWEEKRSLHAE